MKRVKPYIISIIIALGVGIVSSLLTMDNMRIYSEVNTPPLSPPSIVFPIAWSILFLLMGISAAMIYTSDNASLGERKKALYIYALSLFFNFTWSLIFFNLREFLFAFIWLVALFVLILKTIIEYYKINKVAGLLQIPYAIWVAFAGYLNFSIWLMN